MRAPASRARSDRNTSAESRPSLLRREANVQVQPVQASHPHSFVGGRTKAPQEPPRSYLDRSGESGVGPRLEGKRILVVEDEFLLADEMVDWLKLRGAEPVGPIATLAQGQRLVEQNIVVDLAVLDINLAGATVFPLALALQRRGVPLLFASAYAEDMAFPDELKDKLRLKKPFSEAQLIRAVELALDAAG